MPDRILMHPENRWLASSGSNDFSLYGAQPDPVVSLRAASNSERSDETGAGAIGAVALADQDLLRNEGSLASGALPAPSADPQPIFPLTAPVSIPDSASSAATDLPQPLATGSLTPIDTASGVSSPNPPAEASQAALSAPVDPPQASGSPASGPSSVAASGAASSRPEAFDGAPPVVQADFASLPAEGVRLVAPVLGPAEGSLSHIVNDAVTVATSELPSPAEALPIPTVLVPGVAPDTIAQATEPVDLVTSALPGSLTDTLSGLSTAKEPAELSAALSGTQAFELLGDATGGIFAELGPADAASDPPDDVQDLLGSDPVAGIATLVSLVSVTDVLPVSELPDDAAKTAEDPTSLMLDALASDPPDPPDAPDQSNLLGDAAPPPPVPGVLNVPAPPPADDLTAGLG